MPQGYEQFVFSIATRGTYEVVYHGGAAEFASFNYDSVGLFPAEVPEGVPVVADGGYYAALRRDHCDDFTDGRIRSGWEQNLAGGVIKEAGIWMDSERDGTYAKQSRALLFDPVSTGVSAGNTYNSTHLMRKITGAGDFAASVRIEPLKADQDFWTSGIQFWFDTVYGNYRWQTRLEVGATYDSTAGGRRLFFCVTWWDNAHNRSYSHYTYGALLTSDIHPVEVAIVRVNTNTTPEFQMWYRMCTSSGWGAWTQYTDFDPEDYWPYADLDESSVWLGCYGYTYGASGKQAAFDDFAYGPSLSQQAGYAGSNLASIEWEPIDSGNTLTRWALDTFQSWDDNEGNSDVEFGYSVSNNAVAGWSSWLTAAQMAQEPAKEGRYFHLRARFKATSDNSGMSRLWAARITRSLGPLIDFEASPMSADEPPLTAHFTPAIATAIQGLEWNFGDESSPSGEFEPDHTYTQPGKFSPSLTAWNEDGLTTVSKTTLISVGEPPPPPGVDFEGSPLDGYAPLQVSFYDRSDRTTKRWHWEFGDGAASDLANPTHAYSQPGTYDVSYTAWDLSESSATETKYDYISVTAKPQIPFPEFSWESSPPTSGGPPPYRVLFSDRSSGYPTSWLWDFGDERTSEEQNPEHSYADEGIYDVRLTVSNDNGSNSFTWDGAIVVANIPNDLDPDASYGRSVWHIKAGDENEGYQWDVLNNVKHVEFTLLRSGGCGPGRLILAREWAERSGISVGDSIAIVHHDVPDPYEDYTGFTGWYLGYVEDVRADLRRGTVEYILAGHLRHLSDVYPGGNDESDHPIYYRWNLYYEAAYGPDPNDPQYLGGHWDETQNKLSDIVEDLYGRYLDPLLNSNNTKVFPVGADIDATPAETDVRFLKLDGSRNLAEVLDMLARLAGGWTWGIDVEEHWTEEQGQWVIDYIYPRFFFKRPAADSDCSVQIGDRLEAFRESESKRYLFNELWLEGAYSFGAMPYVIPFNMRFRHEGSIASYGRRRISLTVPEIKTAEEAQAYAGKFFSEYARPRNFLTLRQIGSPKRLAPWRRFYPQPEEETEPRGGLLTLKDKSGGLIGIFDFEESRCVFDDCAVWTAEAGPRDPRLKAGAAGVGLWRGGFSHSHRPRKTQEAVTQPEAAYKPVFLGYAKIITATYNSGLKDYLYTILPISDPVGNPVENAAIIPDVYNVMSTLSVPDFSVGGASTVAARSAEPGTQVAYYRGWNQRTRSVYYYISEMLPRLSEFGLIPTDSPKNTTAFTRTVTIPPESCLYKVMKERHQAPQLRIGGDSYERLHWDIWATFDYNTPAIILHGRTRDGKPHSTWFPVHVWYQVRAEKRGDM